MSKILLFNLLFASCLILFIFFLIKKKTILLFKYLIYFLEKSNYFFNYKIYSKYLHVNNKVSYSSNKFAIIVQGPSFDNSYDFTSETLRYYSKKFPNSIIIFSSWEKDINQIKCQLFKKNVHFLRNKLPNYPGSLNINLQAISTRNAILYAKKLGCRYVLKTRSDLRIYSEDFQKYLFDLINFYKLKKNLISKQKARIISTSFTLRYRIYGLADLCLFGHVDDLYKYFNISTDKSLERKFQLLLTNKKESDDNLYYIENSFCPEIYFFCNYFNKLNIKLKWTAVDYLKKLSENFIIIDNRSLNIYWKKSNKVDNHFNKDIDVNIKSTEFYFSDWLNIFYKFNNIKKL
jgi:hypothetical protein